MKKKHNGEYAILVDAHRKVRDLESEIKNKDAEIKKLHEKFFALAEEAEKNYDKIIAYAESLDLCGGKINKDMALGREPLKDIAYGIGDKK